MEANIDPDFWPEPVSHLRETYLADVDEYVIVAEIADRDINGFMGMRQVYSCLVPTAEVDAVLASIGGIGWEVEAWGPLPDVPPEGRWDGSFWVRGPDGSQARYEALVHGWLSHDRTVMVPDNAFLMCYGLVPRLVGDSQMKWDDPKRPVYDVVEVTPLSIYEPPRKYSSAFVRVRRDYLEDYASLKGCAIVGVYYEERYCSGNPEITAALSGRTGVEFELPGRRICLKQIDPRFNPRAADQLTQVWGCRLVLKLGKRPISEEEKPDLVWPCGRRLKDFRPLEPVFVRDTVLQEWESKADFSIYPRSGDVSYGGWWATSRSYRVGRHHIAVELANLYEGVPSYVIKHFHRFAVPEAEVTRDREAYGERHIGDRAEELIEAFFGLINALFLLSDRLGEPNEYEELCGITPEAVKRVGWWTIEGLKQLGYVVPVNLTQEEFLSRCMRIYQLLERLKPGPVKRIIIRLGLPPAKVKDLGNVGALRYLATICQLAMLSRENGYDLISDFGAVAPLWDKDRRLDFMKPLFALTRLRNLHSHVQESEGGGKLEEALSVFDLNIRAMKPGWGLALDTIYDKLIDVLIGSSRLIMGAR
ncbi:MAG: hypothetical protein BroJett029_33540 [Alphaproteobacteria bacterium]|nr:MAG: hypothetical protein BroJett029_33540 [Alphaproteobacteria bacterium]